VLDFKASSSSSKLWLSISIPDTLVLSLELEEINISMEISRSKLPDNQVQRMD
jgi:hypothetical protein